MLKNAVMGGFLFAIIMSGGPVFVSSVAAQDQAVEKATSEEDSKPSSVGVGARDLAADRVSSEEYINPGLRSLSKLYWRIGKFDISDDEAIDNFMMINECNIYREYSLNDLEWKRIRESTRYHISNSVDHFPSHFQTLVPLELGNYNEEGQYFEIKPESQILNVRKIQVVGVQDNSSGSEGRICGVSKRRIKGYPEGLLINVLHPISFTRIPVSPQMATLYLQKVNEKYMKYDLRSRARYYKRMVYMRGLLSVYSYDNEGNDAHREDKRGLTPVIGHLDGVEIYANPELTLLLYRKILNKGGRGG